MALINKYEIGDGVKTVYKVSEKNYCDYLGGDLSSEGCMLYLADRFLRDVFSVRLVYFLDKLGIKEVDYRLYRQYTRCKGEVDFDGLLLDMRSAGMGRLVDEIERYVRLK